MATPEQQLAGMLEKLEAQTGKTVDQWLRALRNASVTKHGEIVQLLKSKHGVTHGYANLIAHELRKSRDGAPAGSDMVGDQFRGKENLRPVYDSLIIAVRTFGDDVEVAPKKAYVSLRRNTQFALVQPSTKTRIDVGIKLKGTPPKGRLEASGSFNAMVTHRVRLSTEADIDEELLGWLERAYEQA